MSKPTLASAQSRSLSATIDIGVVIDRVRVVTSAHTYSTGTHFESTAASGWPSTAHAGDCRIRIGELLIETLADANFVAAYQLGREVAQELAAGLLSIQEKRLQTLLHSHNGMGPVIIESLRARLLGPEGDSPLAHVICQDLIEAVEGRLPP